MAGRDYSFVIDSYFRPFSMQELLYPFLEYREAYNKLDDAYYDMQSRMDKFKYLRDLPETSIARQIYDNYYNDFNRSASEFYERGLYPGNRRAFSNLRRRYAGEIGRLEEADLKKRTQMQEQHAMSLQDPTKLYSRDAASTSLDAYIENPDLTYNAYSGALLAQQVGTAAAAIAKGLSNYGSGKKLDKFTNTFIQQHGFTKEEVAQAVANPRDPNNAKVLNALVEDVVGSSGIAAWNDPVTLDKAYKFASMGLWNAVGETKLERYEDYGARLAAQTAAQDRLNARQHARTMAAARAAQNNGGRVNLRYDKRNVRTPQELEKAKRFKMKWDAYKEYFYTTKNGNIMMTSKGRQLYNSDPQPEYTGNNPMSAMTYRPNGNGNKNDFKEWVDEMGLSQMAKGYTGPYQTAIINNMKSLINNVYDAKQATEYIGIPVDASQYDNVVATLSRASNSEGKLYNWTRKKVKDGTYEWAPTSEVLNTSKLSKEDIKSVTPILGIHGNFISLKLKDGKEYTIPYDELSATYGNMLNGNIGDAYGWSLRGNDLGVANAINMGMSNAMSALGTTTIKNSEVDRGIYMSDSY